MKKLLFGVIMTALSVSIAGSASAQDPSSPASAGMDRLQKVLGQQSLQAKVIMTFAGSKKAEKIGPMEFIMMMSKGKSRMEMDMTKMSAAAGANAGTMPAGMDKMVNISRPDKKVVYQVLPGLNAYCEMAIPEAPGGTADATKIERNVEGTEKVDKYECQKVRNSVTAPDGTKTDFLTWEAKELKGLPIKMETETPEGKMTMMFKDIKTDAPDAALFEPPKGATKYGSMQEMMMSGMMKMMPGK
jgi:outer membrane lipoprotein-sorting protein